MVQRDTIYWYEFNPGQGDVQVGEPDGIVLKLGNKRRLQSGQTFQYTTSRGLDMSYSKICFEGDTTEYFCLRQSFAPGYEAPVSLSLKALFPAGQLIRKPVMVSFQTSLVSGIWMEMRMQLQRC